jgi:hypothetical protein
MMRTCASLEDKAAVAIGALDEIFVAHFQIDPWMAQRPADPVAGDAGLIDFNGFRDFDRHGRLGIWRDGAIIALKIGLARG